jgi:hypothetical protein
MAFQDLVIFDEVTLSVGRGDYNLTSDSISLILITTLPTPGALTPDRLDFAEVPAGGNYSTGGVAMTTTYTETAATATLSSSTDPVWAAAAGSPTNIVAALIVNNTHAGTTDAIGYVDLTQDAGTTPVSMVTGQISVTWTGGDIFTLAVI